MQIQLIAKLTSPASGKSTTGTILFTNEHGIALDIASEIARVIKERGWELEVKYLPDAELFERNEEGLITDHAWVRSRPTLTDAEKCATCDQPRMQHEVVEG